MKDPNLTSKFHFAPFYIPMYVQYIKLTHILPYYTTATCDNAISNKGLLKTGWTSETYT